MYCDKTRTTTNKTEGPIFIAINEKHRKHYPDGITLDPGDVYHWDREFGGIMEDAIITNPWAGKKLTDEDRAKLKRDLLRAGKSEGEAHSMSLECTYSWPGEAPDSAMYKRGTDEAA